MKQTYASQAHFLSCFFIFLVNGSRAVSTDHVTLLFVGDVSFSGAVRYYMEHKHHSYNACLADVAHFIRNADFSVANLESSFVNETLLPYKYEGRKAKVLDSSPQSVSALRFAGFDAVTVANNHFNDFGDAGANFTVRVLRDAGVQYFGVSYGPYDSSQVPLIVDKRGIKIGFLGYCDCPSINKNCTEMRMEFNSGPAVYRDDSAARDVKRLKTKVDIVVVYFHWGQESFLTPLPYQLRITKYLMSLGVHLIIGSHPHIIQPHSFHGNKLVKFSLGNFLFTPIRTPGGNNPKIFGGFGAKEDKVQIAIYEKTVFTDPEITKSSQLFRVKISRKGIEYADYLPLEIAFDFKKYIHLEPAPDLKWIPVCGNEDQQCKTLKALKGSE